MIEFFIGLFVGMVMYNAVTQQPIQVECRNKVEKHEQKIDHISK